MMNSLRRVLGAFFTLLGAYYCALGMFTLVRLPDVTRQWIERSGDQDFRYDYGGFMMYSALGATMIAVLGCATVVKGVANARGRDASWLGPAIGALPLHWFWFLYRVIGAGVLDRQGQIASRRAAAIQFGVVCIGYWLMWVVSRQSNRPGPANVRLQPTTAGAMLSRRG